MWEDLVLPDSGKNCLIAVLVLLFQLEHRTYPCQAFLQKAEILASSISLKEVHCIFSRMRIEER